MPKLFLVAALAASGCAASDSAGMCGGGVPQGQACNAIVDSAAIITPTCSTASADTGTGGTIADGTYVLTEQVYYDRVQCTVSPIAGTFVVAGGCVQLVANSGSVSLTSSGTFAVQGNMLTVMETCANISGASGPLIQDAPYTFTATAAGFTLFTQNAKFGNPNPDRMEVYVKR